MLVPVCEHLHVCVCIWEGKNSTWRAVFVRVMRTCGLVPMSAYPRENVFVAVDETQQEEERNLGGLSSTSLAVVHVPFNTLGDPALTLARPRLGSEAMEAALKMARQYHLEKQPPQPQRTKFIARKESYHGTTLGALGVGGHVARRALFEPLLTQTHSRVSACNVYRGLCAGETVEGYVARLAQELDDEFVRLGPENVCAFVAEPVVGAVRLSSPRSEDLLRHLLSAPFPKPPTASLGLIHRWLTCNRLSDVSPRFPVTSRPCAASATNTAPC